MADEISEARRLLSWWVEFVQSTDDTPEMWRPEIWNQMRNWMERNAPAEMPEPTERRTP